LENGKRERAAIPEQLLKRLLEDPNFLNRLERGFEKEKFLKEFKVQKATPLKCPACSYYMQTGGTLWGPVKDEPNHYVCRKCRLVWELKCVSEPTEELFQKLRQIKKGEVVDAPTENEKSFQQRLFDISVEEVNEGGSKS